MNTNIRTHLLEITSLANDYCNLLQQAGELEKPELLVHLTGLLPHLYYEFATFNPALEETPSHDEDEEGYEPDPDELLDLEETEERFYNSYVDEDFYESIRRHIEVILGPEDVFLETFEEDMKYSDTPIAASISESLADIFQPLYNFISVVKDSDGEELEGAYQVCRENFVEYWAQTLCNVMRPLNNLRFHSVTD